MSSWSVIASFVITLADPLPGQRMLMWWCFSKATWGVQLWAGKEHASGRRLIWGAYRRRFLIQIQFIYQNHCPWKKLGQKSQPVKVVFSLWIINHTVVWPAACLWSLTLPWRLLLFIFSSAFPPPATPALCRDGGRLRSHTLWGRVVFLGHCTVCVHSFTGVWFSFSFFLFSSKSGEVCLQDKRLKRLPGSCSVRVVAREFYINSSSAPPLSVSVLSHRCEYLRARRRFPVTGRLCYRWVLPQHQESRVRGMLPWLYSLVRWEQVFVWILLTVKLLATELFYSMLHWGLRVIFLQSFILLFLLFFSFWFCCSPTLRYFCIAVFLILMFVYLVLQCRAEWDPLDQLSRQLCLTVTFRSIWTSILKICLLR